MEAVETLMDYLWQRGPDAFSALVPLIAASPTLADTRSGRQLLKYLTTGSSGPLRSASANNRCGDAGNGTRFQV